MSSNHFLKSVRPSMVVAVVVATVTAVFGANYVLSTKAATVTTTADRTGDLNADGRVNVFDLSILLNNWYDGPVATPTPAPTSTPTPSVGRAPVGDLPNWRQTFAENFDANTRPAVWRPYSSTLCCGDKYDDGANTSFSGGQMQVAIRNVGGMMRGAAGQFGTTEFIGMRTAIRFKIDAPFSGAGMANMIWPSNDVWGEGEIDWPEVQFNENIGGFIHEVGAHPENNSTVVNSTVSPTDWHVAVTEWVPGQYVRMYLDDKLMGEEKVHVPTTTHGWRWQAADNGSADSNGGLIRIDWVAQWQRN